MVVRNAVLTETHYQLVQALVASGRYQNVSDAIRRAFRLTRASSSTDPIG